MCSVGLLATVACGLHTYSASYGAPGVSFFLPRTVLVVAILASGGFQLKFLRKCHGQGFPGSLRCCTAPILALHTDMLTTDRQSITGYRLWPGVRHSGCSTCICSRRVGEQTPNRRGVGRFRQLKGQGRVNVRQFGK